MSFTFQIFRAESLQIFEGFFWKIEDIKIHSEINWPLIVVVFITINQKFVIIGVCQFRGFILQFVDVVTMINVKNFNFCRFFWKLCVNNSKSFYKDTFGTQSVWFNKKFNYDWFPLHYTMYLCKTNLVKLFSRKKGFSSKCVSNIWRASNYKKIFL